jgi:hypothetical protein
MRSWIAAADDSNIMLIRFEDLVDASRTEALYRAIFQHCDIDIPSDVLRALLVDHSFTSLSGRELGVENEQSHYRKGTPGDWKLHFTARVEEAMDEVAGDLLDMYGYTR